MIQSLWHNKTGFTLIELLIVIAILGMLATIAVPKVNDILVNSREKVISTNAQIVENAIDMFYADHQKYPEVNSMEDLEQELRPYIKEIPEDVKDNYRYMNGEIQRKDSSNEE